MADPSGSLLVLNGFVLWEELGITLLGGQPPEASRLYASLLKYGHAILFTSPLARHYQTILKDPGFPATVVEEIGQQLQALGVAVTSGEMIRHAPDPPVRRYHRVFFAEAIRYGAKYLLTEREPWLDVARSVRRQYGLDVVRPATYLRRNP